MLFPSCRASKRQVGETWTDNFMFMSLRHGKTDGENRISSLTFFAIDLDCR